MKTALQQYSPIIFLFAFFAIMYLTLILPQKNYQKKRKKMLDSLRSGDKVLTIGGIYGTITKFSNDDIKLKIAQNVEIKITKESISKKID